MTGEIRGARVAIPATATERSGRQQRGAQRLGHFDAADAGRHDAAGIARAFAGRIQAAHVEALVVLAARDAQRRRRAGLDAGQHRVRQREALDLALERRQRLADRVERVVGQAAAALLLQVGQVHARLVRGLHVAEGAGALALDEVTHQRARRHVAAAAEFVGARFPEALERDAVERAHDAAGLAVLAIVLWVDAHDDAGVGVAFVARILAHAIGDDAIFFRRRRDDGAARAHAEAVDRAAIARVVHQLVVGRAEDLVARVRAEARAVDQALRVLDAVADRE